jgi:hypothetical protein
METVNPITEHVTHLSVLCLVLRLHRQQKTIINISHMKNLTALITYQDEGIRVTPDGQTSVFDFIRVVGGSSQPRKVFQRLSEQYPEVVSICHNFQFPGQGQRLTPVAGKEGILQILGLLPSAVGRKYRAVAAKLVLAFYEAPEELAVAAFDRITDKKKVERSRARIEGIATRKAEIRALASTRLVTNPHQYAHATNTTYKGLFGCTAKELREQKGLKQNDKLRDHFDDLDLAAIRLVELVVVKNAESARTYPQLEEMILAQAEKVREAIA